MLSKCANPACSTPFRRLREGKLFVVETEGTATDQQAVTPMRRARLLRRVEHFWLCDECSAFITLTFDRERGMITVPLPETAMRHETTLRSLPSMGPSRSVPETVPAGAFFRQGRGA